MTRSFTCRAIARPFARLAIARFYVYGLDLGSHIQLVPIKTLQSLHAKFKVINESFETNLDCTMTTKD